MSNDNIINSFLGLQSYGVVTWKRHNKKSLEIWLEPRKHKWTCDGCGRTFQHHYDHVWVRLRDLNIGPHKVWLWVCRHRIDCPQCGVRRVSLPIARPQSRCTRRYERWLFQLTGGTTLKDQTSLKTLNFLLSDRKFNSLNWSQFDLENTS